MQSSVGSKCKQSYKLSSVPLSPHAYPMASNDLGSIKTGRKQTIIEELQSLRNENFNLKLEKHCFPSLGKSQCSKDLFDRPVCESHVITTLRKELKIKTEIMMQTAATIEMQKKMLKDSVAENEAKFAELMSYIEKLKPTADELKTAKARIEELKSELRISEETVTSCEAKIKELAVKNSRLIDSVLTYRNDNFKTKVR